MGDQPRNKKARTTSAPALTGGAGLGGLYDFLPPPDPVKDEAAKVEASKNQFKKRPLPPEDKTKVIFLDVDGVLLPSGSLETVTIDGVPVPVRDTVPESDFSKSALGSLREIVQQTGATIVLSSEWRRTPKLRESLNSVLKSQDIPVLRDFTEIFHTKYELARQSPILGWVERRAREIGKWLKDHPEVTAWVALDDLDFAHADHVRAAGTPFIKYRSVHTDDKTCLIDEQVAGAVDLLLNPPPEPKPLMRPKSQSAGERESVPFVSTEDSMPERIRLG